jgi:hypothetical protein
LFGCLGLLLAVVVLALAIAGLTWRSIHSADPRDAVLVHEGAPSREVTLDVDGADEADEADDADPFKVLLELDSCELFLEPAAPGEPLSVEAHYDANDYRLEQSMEGEDPGTYRLRFLVTSSRLITGIKQGIRGGQPQLRIALPQDVPFELTLVQRNGGAVVDLSGLHLLAADFDAGGALLKVDADTPLTGRMKRLTVRGGQGGLFLESLNLMQPEEIDVDFRMGQAHLDFRGPWAVDTDVGLTLSLTDAILRLPQDARVEGLTAVPAAPMGPVEMPQRTLAFSVESGTRTTVRVFE